MIYYKILLISLYCGYFLYSNTVIKQIPLNDIVLKYYVIYNDLIYVENIIKSKMVIDVYEHSKSNNDIYNKIFDAVNLHYNKEGKVSLFTYNHKKGERYIAIYYRADINHSISINLYDRQLNLIKRVLSKHPINREINVIEDAIDTKNLISDFYTIRITDHTSNQNLKYEFFIK